MHQVIPLLVIAILALITPKTQAQCSTWNYNNAQGTGPLFWGRLCPEYALCDKGRSQSPIDIVATQEEIGTSHIVPKYHPATNVTLLNEFYAFEVFLIVISNLVVVLIS